MVFAFPTVRDTQIRVTRRLDVVLKCVITFTHHMIMTFLKKNRGIPVALSLLILVLVSGSYLLLRNESSTPALPDTVDFNQHVRPILSSNCYVCHGPDISTREAGLRLDLRDSAIVELESGQIAVVPGDHKSSELIARVRSSDPEERMPPPELKKVLSDYEVEVLKRWIDQGAEWKKHWSFVPPQVSRLPHVRRTKFVNNDIDRFVVERLEREGLQPATVADRETLIRRLSFVLTGLPPTPEGVAAFVEDPSELAYEKLVDRLLSSDHFGEKWARHWMDIVRYADTKGHEFDFPVIGAWQYRDYLIRAFNDDVPYDQFIKEHLAGDLIANPRMHPLGYNESELATAYLALGEGKHSPVDLWVDEAERIDNIIDVTSKAFQGLTVACAKCHDHKFDPIPTTDYYSMYGIFKSSRFALRSSNTGQETLARTADLRDLQEEMQNEISQSWLSDLESGSTDQASSILARLTVSEPAGFDTSAEDTAGVHVIGDFRNGGFNDWFVDGVGFGEGPVSGDIRMGMEDSLIQSLGEPRASSAALSSKLQGALRSPTFEIAHDTITVRAAGLKSTVRVVIDNFQLIRYPIYGQLEMQLESKTMQNYPIDVSMWKGHKAYIELISVWDDGREQFHIDDTSYVDVEYAVGHNKSLEPQFITERIALSDTEAISSITRWKEGKAGSRDIQILNTLLDRGILSRSPGEFNALYQRQKDIEQGIPEVTLFMGMVDGDGDDHPVFVRGSTKDLSEEAVPRRALTLVDSSQAPFAVQGSGRKELAHSIASSENPLTARVMVNRVWHHVFGRGLVETVDNFGVQGKLPTHPELLDHLALQFMDRGWSVKSLIREMVLSQAFQRVSSGSEKAMSMDPENLLLQHYSTRRLEAEAIRDAMLFVSGRFNPEMYGEGVPIYLSEFMKGRGRPAQSGPLDGDGRRSIYISVRRNFLSPMMLVFDMPIPFTTFGRRNTSSVPAQSLTLLNDPFVSQQAEVWARHVVLLKELDATHRIRHMYREAFAREATDIEVEEGIGFLESQAEYYALASDGWLNDVRPWRDYCHAVFNMKEFIHLI